MTHEAIGLSIAMIVALAALIWLCFRKPRQRPFCNGTGKVLGERFDCGMCDGTGERNDWTN